MVTSCSFKLSMFGDIVGAIQNEMKDDVVVDIAVN